MPDYSLSAAREILLEHHQREHLDLGVSGYKFDEDGKASIDRPFSKGKPFRSGETERQEPMMTANPERGIAMVLMR